jgi:uncharacterized protein YgfB (UPF0149 family)
VTPSSVIRRLDYDRLRDSLADAGAVVAIAELHGGVCGALCAAGAHAAQRWLINCLDDLDLAAAPAGVAEELEALIGASSKMLVDDELAFEPLLPDDDAPLEEQVQALALWCHGFLDGVSASPQALADVPQLNEILADFAEISRAGLSNDEAAGEGRPDFALAQIHEYVRVSVQLVFEELSSVRNAPAVDLQ